MFIKNKCNVCYNYGNGNIFSVNVLDMKTITYRNWMFHASKFVGFILTRHRHRAANLHEICCEISIQPVSAEKTKRNSKTKI